MLQKIIQDPILLALLGNLLFAGLQGILKDVRSTIPALEVLGMADGFLVYYIARAKSHTQA